MSARLYKLDWKVLRLGPGAAAFLKAYSTNDAERPRNAFIDLKGKIVAAFWQWVSPDGSEALIAMGKDYPARVREHLGRYLDLTGTALGETALSAYWDLDGARAPVEGEKILRETAGAVVFSPHLLEAGVSEAEFRLFRLDHFLPLQGIDYDREMVLNVFDEEIVSYAKGCYLGQEIVARVHYRSKPPRKLAVKAAEGLTPEELASMTSKETDPQSGTTRGFLFTE